MKPLIEAILAGDVTLLKGSTMPRLANTIWVSPLDDCNVCQSDFTDVMYDAALPGLGGAWGNVCQDCFKRHGGALGIGRGQQYELQPYAAGKAWVGVAGFD